MVAVEPLVAVPGDHVGGEWFTIAHVLIVVMVVVVGSVVVIVVVVIVAVVSSVVPAPSTGIQGCVTVQYRFQ